MRPFQPNIEEDLNRPHNVTLTEGQISTILYVLEGYINPSDDYSYDPEFREDIDNIFAELEGVVDKFYDKAVIPEWDETKEDAQVNDVKYSTLNENSDYGVDVRSADDVAKCITNGNDYSECVDELVNSMEKGQ